MIRESLELTQVEKLYLKAGVATLEANEHTTGCHFKIPKGDGYHITMRTALIGPDVRDKLLSALLDAGCEVHQIKDETTIQLHNKYEGIGATSLDAIVDFLDTTWYAQGNNGNYVFLSQFKSRIRDILKEGA